MFPDHVETEVLQNLEVIDHRFAGRRRVEAVRPVALVQRTKHEDKFPVEQGSDNAVNLSFGYGSESGVTLDLIVS